MHVYLCNPTTTDFKSQTEFSDTCLHSLPNYHQSVDVKKIKTDSDWSEQSI